MGRKNATMYPLKKRNKPLQSKNLGRWGDKCACRKATGWLPDTPSKKVSPYEIYGRPW